MPALPAASLATDKPVLLPVGQDYLRDAMRARRTTVTALAAELGISRKHLSNVLNGRAPLVDPLLRRLCRALGVEPELLVALLDYGPEPRPDLLRPHAGPDRRPRRSDRAIEGWEMLED